MCSKLQGPGQKFRQDGAALPTPAGTNQLSVLVPYVYANAAEPIFINSGYESLLLSYDTAAGVYRIKQVTEFFTRNALPPVFNQNN